MPSQQGVPLNQALLAQANAQLTRCHSAQSEKLPTPHWRPGRTEGIRALSIEGTSSTLAERVQSIEFSGTYNNDGAEVEAIAVVGKQPVQYDAVLRLLAAG